MTLTFNWAYNKNNLRKTNVKDLNERQPLKNMTLDRQ